VAVVLYGGRHRRTELAVNRRIIGLPDKGCFAWFACRPGFTKMKDEGGERRWKVAEARIGDEHGFEKHREGMALLCEASKAMPLVSLARFLCTSSLFPRPLVCGVQGSGKVRRHTSGSIPDVAIETTIGDWS
jgi:hypothetical protein